MNSDAVPATGAAVGIELAAGLAVAIVGVLVDVVAAVCPVGNWSAAYQFARIADGCEVERSGTVQKVERQMQRQMQKAWVYALLHHPPASCLALVPYCGLVARQTGPAGPPQ